MGFSMCFSRFWAMDWRETGAAGARTRNWSPHRLIIRSMVAGSKFSLYEGDGVAAMSTTRLGLDTIGRFFILVEHLHLMVGYLGVASRHQHSTIQCV